MTFSLVLLIFLGPFLAVAPVVFAAAPQIPGFFGQMARPAQSWTATARPIRRTAVRFA